MFEIIAAIVGVLFGAFVSWWLNRTRPLFIICEDSFRARIAIGGEPWGWSTEWQAGKGQSLISFGIGLPETKLLFREIPIDTLSVLRLKFRNVGNLVIDKPRIDISLAESATVLRCDFHVEPEHLNSHVLDIKETGTEKNIATPGVTTFENNKIALTIDNLYPFGVSQDVAVLNIFCNGEIGKINVSGRGVLHNGSIWAVKFEPWLKARERIERNLTLFARINYWGLMIAIMSYVGIKLFSDQTNSTLFTIIVVWLLLFLVFIIYVAILGLHLYLDLPFIKRRLVVYLEKLSFKK